MIQDFRRDADLTLNKTLPLSLLPYRSFHLYILHFLLMKIIFFIPSDPSSLPF